MRVSDLVAVTDAVSARFARRGYCPHTPHPKQRHFLILSQREALYGGAAGGGKSDALLMGALEHVDVPGYAALILRRTYQDLALPGAIMDRSHEWLKGTDASWNGTDKRWVFPSGASLSFGYLDTDRDRFRYASAEFQYIAFDELTQFPEQWYRFLFSRLRRRRGVDVPLRMRAATNPGGIGHEWVRRRFIEPGDERRPFISALLVDNPSLDAEEYRETLAELDATTRAQLEDGVWTRDAEGLVYHFDEARNTTRLAPPDCYRKVLGLDFGVTDPTAGVVLGWAEHDPTVYVLETFKKSGMIPSEAAEKVAELMTRHRFNRIVGDIGGLGKGFVEEARRRFRLPIEPAEKVNKYGYVSLLNGDLERGRIKVLTPACKALTDEWAELPWNEDRTKEADGFDNHLADACLYAWRTTYAFNEKPAPEELTPGQAMAQVKTEFLLERQKQRRWEERHGRLPPTHRRIG